MQHTGPYAQSALGTALAALALEAHGVELCSRGSDRVLALMQLSTDPNVLSDLGTALAALAQEAHGEQASRGSDRILSQMQQTNRPHALSALGTALAALAREAHGEQASRLSDRILAQMQQATDPDALSALGRALAALAREAHGEQASRLSDRILAQMQQTTDPLALSALGTALAALAAVVATDPGEMKTIERVTNAPTPIDCGVIAVAMPAQGMPMLVDMLKWPTCGNSRNGVMLRIVELEKADPKMLDAAYDPSNRSGFKASLPGFIVWLRTQKDSNGKPFDIESPPSVRPHPR
jgi:hypothetical protein